MLGRYVSDLEEGERLEPVRYVMSPFVVREYCHGIDEDAALFDSDLTSPTGRQQAPPTLVHIDKIRLIKHNCPEGPGPNARIHFEFSSQQHEPIPVGEELVASGIVSRRYEKRGREYLEMEIEMRTAAQDRLLVSYRDTAILSYAPSEGTDE